MFGDMESIDLWYSFLIEFLYFDYLSIKLVRISRSLLCIVVYMCCLFCLETKTNKLVVFLMEEIYRFLYIMLSRILFPRRKSTLSLTGPLPVCFLFSETTKINHVTCLQNILHSIVCFIWKLINIVCCGSFVL